jgi:hypothetical protein
VVKPVQRRGLPNNARIGGPLDQSIVYESSESIIKIRFLSGLGAGLDFQILSGHGSPAEVQKANGNLVAKEREEVDQMQCLSLLQTKQIIHDAQEWFRELFVSHLGFDMILLNGLSCGIQTMTNSVDRQR